MDGRFMRVRDGFPVQTIHQMLYAGKLPKLMLKRRGYPHEACAPAKEVINCQCQALIRSVTAMDEDEYNRLKQRAGSIGLNGTYKGFEDFKNKYLKASKNKALRCIMVVVKTMMHKPQ